jgi:hypothetical protein
MRNQAHAPVLVLPGSFPKQARPLRRRRCYRRSWRAGRPWRCGVPSAPAHQPIRPRRIGSDYSEQGDEPCGGRIRPAVPSSNGALRRNCRALAGHRESVGGKPAGRVARAGWATRLRSETLYRVIAVLLVALRPRHDIGIAPVHRTEAGGGGRGGMVRDWRFRGPDGRRGGRTPDTDTGAAIRGRYQAGWKPVARGESADNAGRLHTIQPRSKFCGRWSKPRVSADNGGRLNRRHLHRRTTSWLDPEWCAAARSGSHPRVVSHERLAPFLNERRKIQRAGAVGSVGGYSRLRCDASSARSAFYLLDHCPFLRR